MHLVCVRERVKQDIAVFPKDNLVAVIGKPILSLGPSFGAGEFISRCERITANNAQNRKGFMLLACFALSSAGALPTKGKEALVAYTYSRIAHNVFMALKIGTLRSAAYLSSTVAALYVCGGCPSV